VATTIDTENEACVGDRMHGLMTELFPLCRSITGEGVRETLRRVSARIPLEVHEVATGTRVLDWTIPREWNVRDAYVTDPRGRRVIDFQDNNLHLVSYSVPFHGSLPLSELRSHLFTAPDRPDVIPYRTSYYEEAWGFCVSDRALRSFAEGDYEVRVDSTLEDGSLTYGECLVPGETTDEVLISTHVCHPSLANDNLSGIALATFLAMQLSGRRPRLSYRFLFVPGTIGSIAWLARNDDAIGRIRHGLVVSCVGDPGRFTYKRSRRGDAQIDRAVVNVLEHAGLDHQVVDFSPYGYDERQYCSPGFDLPVGCLSRTPNGAYPEYHTSADDLALVTPDALEESLGLYTAVIEVLENDATFVNRSPYGEPQLGRRGLYPSVGGTEIADAQLAMLWVLNLSDGTHGLLDIAERAGMPFGAVLNAARRLVEHGLLAPTSRGSGTS
jgi:aminopeptidase-like protein